MVIDKDIMSGIIGLLGAVIGGAATLYGAKYTLKKQFEYTLKMNKVAEEKLLKNSLSVVLNEISNNHVLA